MALLDARRSHAVLHSVSVSVSVLANNALRAHHASVHGGVSTNGPSDILRIFLKMILLSCLK